MAEVTKEYTSRPIINAFCSGCLSGVISTVCFQPLDVIKTKVQANSLLNLPANERFGIVKSLWRQPDSGRLLVLWSGTVPALWRCVPGVGGYFACLSLLEGVYLRYYPLDRSQALTVWESFLLGFISRSFVSSVLTPFSVAKTQAEWGYHRDQSMCQTLQRIRKQARWSGLYSGMWATIVRDSPYSGIYFAFYSTTKSLLQTNFDANTWPLVTVSAGVSACFATTVTQPADVLRAHRQMLLHKFNANFNLPSTLSSHSWWDVFRKIVQTNGVVGLWRGLSMRLLRRIGVACVSWNLYEAATTS